MGKAAIGLCPEVVLAKAEGEELKGYREKGASNPKALTHPNVPGPILDDLGPAKKIKDLK